MYDPNIVSISDKYSGGNSHLRRRLDKWAYLISEIPRHRFDMCIWFHNLNQSPTRIHNAEDTKHWRGTRACALGWAAVYAPFNKLGLKLETDPCSPSFRGLTCVSACSEFFQIPHQVAAWVVIDTTYHDDRTITPKRVARRIRRVVDYHCEHGTYVGLTLKQLGD